MLIEIHFWAYETIWLLMLSYILQVAKLMARVEATFIKHFANGNHRKGMNSLRPKAKKETHSITFFLGKTSSNCHTFLLYYIFLFSLLIVFLQVVSLASR